MRNNKSFIRTPAEVKTEGNGTPLSPGPWGSLPGPELSRSRRLDPSGLDWAILDPSNRLLNSLGLEAEGFDRALSESRPKGGRLSRLIMERREPDSVRGWQKDNDVSSTLLLSLPFFVHRGYTDSASALSYLPFVSSLAFCVAKSASQCRAELLPSPDERDSLAEVWLRLQGEDVPLVELLVLPTVSPPPLSDGAAVCVVSVLTADASPSDFGVEPIPEAAVVRMPPLLVVDCWDKHNQTLKLLKMQKCKTKKKMVWHKSTCVIPLGALGRTRGLVCRLAQGQLALMPHFPLAECTMSPML